MIMITAFGTILSCAVVSFGQTAVDISPTETDGDAKIYMEVKAVIDCEEKFNARGLNPPTAEDLKDTVCTKLNNTATNFDDLLAKSDLLVKHNPKMADYYLLRGKVRYYKSFATGLAMFDETFIISSRGQSIDWLAKISTADIAAEIKDFSDALTINPNVKLNDYRSAEAHRFRGKNYAISAAKNYSKQNLQNALVDFDEAGKLDEWVLPADDFRKQIYLISKDGDLVGQDFARRIKENPADAKSIYLERARYLSLIVEYNKALADVLRYANSSGADKDITQLTYLTIIKYAGNAYKNKHLDTAQDYLEKASLEIQFPANQDAAFNDATEAVKLNSLLTAAHIIRAKYLIDKGKTDEGIAEANVAIAQDADNVGALCIRGVGFAIKNDIKTIDDLNRAILLDPELASLYNAFGIRARVYTALGKTDLAAADMQKGTQLAQKIAEIKK